MSVQIPQSRERGSGGPARLSPASHLSLRTAKASLHSGCFDRQGCHLAIPSIALIQSAEQHRANCCPEINYKRCVARWNHQFLLVSCILSEPACVGCEVLGDVMCSRTPLTGSRRMEQTEEVPTGAWMTYFMRDYQKPHILSYIFCHRR